MSSDIIRACLTLEHRLQPVPTSLLGDLRRYEIKANGCDQLLPKACDGPRTRGLNEEPPRSLPNRFGSDELEGWILTQPRPGIMIWQAPTGRRYSTTPARYAS
jgi:hypothetical protein